MFDVDDVEASNGDDAFGESITSLPSSAQLSDNNRSRSFNACSKRRRNLIIFKNHIIHLYNNDNNMLHSLESLTITLFDFQLLSFD